MRQKDKYLQSETQSEKYKVEACYCAKGFVNARVSCSYKTTENENTGRCCVTNVSSSLVM